MGPDSSGRPSVDALNDDPSARLDFLVDADVLEVDDEDAVTTTTAFEDTRSIYADTYKEGELPEAQYVETVADLFDLSPEAARSRIEAEDVTRHEVITYLSLRSYLDRDLPREPLALLAAMAAEVGVGSPVPDYMDELTDETYAAALDAERAVAVFVWKYPCDPCRRMKGELPALLERLPDSVAVAGVDGERVTAFREAFDVDSAPVVLLFEDGAVEARHVGYTPPAVLARSLSEVYEGVSLASEDGDGD